MKTGQIEAKSRSPHLYFVGGFSDNRDDFWYADPGSKLLYLEEGSQIIHTTDRSLAVAAGTICVLPDGTPHQFESRGHYRSHVVRFSPGYLEWDESLRTFGCEQEEGAMFLSVLDVLGRLYYGTTPIGKSPHITMALTLLVEWLKTVEHRGGQERPMPSGVLAARRLIEEQVTQSLSLQQIAERVHLSTSHLRNSFARHMGCAPLHYQQELRMERACRLLSLPWMSIEQVARNCGYADAHYFARLFRKKFGLSPSQWRNTQTGNGKPLPEDSIQEEIDLL